MESSSSVPGGGVSLTTRVARVWCHSCNAPTTAEFKEGEYECLQCSGSFVEELEQGIELFNPAALHMSGQNSSDDSNNPMQASTQNSTANRTTRPAVPSSDLLETIFGLPHLPMAPGNVTTQGGAAASDPFDRTTVQVPSGTESTGERSGNTGGNTATGNNELDPLALLMHQFFRGSGDSGNVTFTSTPSGFVRVNPAGTRTATVTPGPTAPNARPDTSNSGSNDGQQETEGTPSTNLGRAAAAGVGGATTEGGVPGAGGGGAEGGGAEGGGGSMGVLQLLDALGILSPAGMNFTGTIGGPTAGGGITLVRGPGGGIMGPMMLGGFGGMMGADAMTEQQLQQFLHQMLMADGSGSGPPPATESAIEALTRTYITEDMNKSELGECSISQEGYETGEVMITLPCGHHFKEEPIVHWLKMHDACPVCRINIGSASGGGNTDHSSGGGSSSDSSSDSSNSNSNSGNGSHSSGNSSDSSNTGSNSSGNSAES